MKRFLLFTTNKRREKIYDLRCKMSKFLYKFLQECLLLLPIITQIVLFCISKIF
jgi:hypothetical protein